ncbi:Cdc25 phosphatase Ibp1 [Yamadazyma tenuis]|uniref:Rhodanese-like protein n=1 Tax=Candida tenuis (strain ATCC 10573 / BCRC 21748 / CBS 615 / JCM 9827 / NBRC 10315 / NRRL Y-1498 / VKM Y-70) TaxID=590646 RepID=G3BF72_CANTC|nr:Rhodanese-like protein [Yamadazyma tenuis ATCC 10573]EGV60656.1 Rhodanese-like protein [Yamadazyma tenuis ATCC 10573]WEJ94092.1 Cdc25 phosphatase Ibp1 [Yamadazyma tenuis]
MSSYGIADLRFIKASTVYSWFKGGAPGRFAVVDVRDSDYVGGHIKNCLHVPAANFHETLPALRQKLFDMKVQDVVFHCALSQVRGPSSTLKFLRSLEEIKDPQQIEFFSNLSVWVMQGGFTAWQQKYGEDESVTEAYDKEIWDFGI